ncbi:hypothetical protein K2X14_02605 [Acetobacter sp. TBRC 12305]|uniref:DUF4296 domain-containing protein n=1 Tax=Acetobacter garciniae TaxID=2817435 RepID=A0A939HN71_9PROT|nr:hypothetical protein [Acetobacter garciniae]MBO1324046.1 hypothetical protein [Acetobacter garciniae]MBX0343735.1 hypothetical protein [Acetobacter garciniae]
MKSPILRRPARLKSLLALMAACGLVAGCQSGPSGLVLRQTPRTVLYSYLVANGMARGRLMSETVTPAEYLHIVQADRSALIAILLFRDKPNPQNLGKAGQRVEDFLGVIEAPSSPLAKGLQLQAPDPKAGAMR